MKRIFFISILILSLYSNAHAQHCRWDFIKIIVLDVRCKNVKVDSLKISLVDSLGRCCNFDIAGKCVFFEKSDSILQPSPNQWAKFDFLKSNYFMAFSFEPNQIDKSIRISISDVDGEKNGGYFKSEIIPINDSDVFSMCDGQRHKIKPLIINLHNQ